MPQQSDDCPWRQRLQQYWMTIAGPTQSESAALKSMLPPGTEGSSAASTKVLLLYELLEPILLHLPLLEILRAQGVCTRWRDVVADSDNIQKALFRTPIDGRRIKFVTPPFQPPRLGDWIPSPERDCRWKFTDDADKVVQPVLNPFLRPNLRKDAIQDLISRTGSRDAHVDQEQSRPLNEGGSWEDMLLVQPVPLDLSYLGQIPEMQFLGQCTQGAFAADNELRLKGVAQSLKRHVDECNKCRHNWASPGRQMFRGTSLMKTVDANVSGWEMLALLRDNIGSADVRSPVELVYGMLMRQLQSPGGDQDT